MLTKTRAITLTVLLISTLSLGVNAAVSNLITDNITIDADLADWESIDSLGHDTDTLTNLEAQADYTEGWIAHDSNSLYVAYRNNGDINRSLWWAWQVYIDIDEDGSTGYTGIAAGGAEYLLQGGGLYKYTGSGVDWSWQYISNTRNAVVGAIAEFKIPRIAIGNPTNIRVVFKTRNGPFTGDYSAAGIDTYPKTTSVLPIHNDLLFRQSQIWTEPSDTLAMELVSAASVGATQLSVGANYPLINGQLMTYLADDGEYYTAHVDRIDGLIITLKKPLQAAINSGQNIWNFYANGSHPNEKGYRAVADFAIRKIGIDNLNSGKHVLLGDSWFDSPGVTERLSIRLNNAAFINQGVGGSTSTEILNRFDSDVGSQNPDFIWVMAGVNDYHHDTPVEIYLANIQAITNKINSTGAQAIIFDAPVSQLFYGNDDRRELSHSYADKLAGGEDGFVNYELGAVVEPPEPTTISNPKSITVDGLLSDWAELQSFGLDGDDINLSDSKADFIEAWMAHDDTNVFIAYQNDGDIDLQTWWPWQIYLDTDKDASTGYNIGNGVGANFIVQGQSLFQYTGTGDNWSWRYLTSVDYSVNNDIAELAFPRSAISNPDSINIIMKTRNGVFTDIYNESSVDSYPDSGSNHFSYDFTDETTSRPVSNDVSDSTMTIDGKSNDWQSLVSFGQDPDDIEATRNHADWLETWAAHDSNNLYFAYENDGDISAVAWPWQIYIDTDNDPSTGYKITNSIGAEFVLEGPNLRQYSGTGDNWLWRTLAVTGSATVGSFSEIAIPRSVLGDLTDFRVIFRADNRIFTNRRNEAHLDYFPDTAISSNNGYLRYSIQ